MAAGFPDIATGSLLVDAAAMEFVRRSDEFDVVVASNLFGDILSDLAAILTGSIGLAASGNINPEVAHPSMFDPVHGSAPDIAGKGLANPMAAILSATMMLDHLGQPAAAGAVRAAVLSVIEQGKTLPADMGGSVGTDTVENAVVTALGGRA